MAKTETVVETVTMTDGRVVEFPGKRKLDKSHTIDEAGNVAIHLDFRNGETRTWKIPPNLIAKCAGHGGEQKLGDEIAGLEEVDDCVEAVDELIMRLNDGEWTVKREANALAGMSILLKAIVQVSGKSAELVRGFLKTKTGIEKQALRDSPKYAPAVKALEAEKAAKRKTVDTAPLEEEIASL